MYFYHHEAVWQRFPHLQALVMVLKNVRSSIGKTPDLTATLATVSTVLAQTSESELPSIRAWRQVYTAMGLKPTQYRCAAEALLRRYRKEQQLPQLHPLVDALNAESMYAAIPIAAFDCQHIAEGIIVREATGTENYLSFQGETEQPAVGEIIFADAVEQAHARRWVFRQSALSTVSAESDTVLLVAEAMHEDAGNDLHRLQQRILARAEELGITVRQTAILCAQQKRFDF